MFTVIFILALAALVLTILSAIGKVQLWIPVLFLCVIELVRNLPLGR